MLRNPLASPDIIGISSGAGAAAVFAIVTLSLGPSMVSIFAIVAALAVAIAVYLLAFKDGVVGTRLILIGIGMAAMLESLTASLLSTAGQLGPSSQATRWLMGQPSTERPGTALLPPPPRRWIVLARSCWVQGRKT